MWTHYIEFRFGYNRYNPEIVIGKQTFALACFGCLATSVLLAPWLPNHRRRDLRYIRLIFDALVWVPRIRHISLPLVGCPTYTMDMTNSQEEMLRPGRFASNMSVAVAQDLVARLVTVLFGHGWKTVPLVAFLFLLKVNSFPRR